MNVAGGMEVALDRTAVRTGVRPAVLLAGAAGLAALAMLQLRRRGTGAPGYR